MIDVARIFLAVLREVFDETSYARFLQRAQMASSPEAYAEFWRERAQSHGRRQRCC
jgi:hypothetical protein